MQYTTLEMMPSRILRETPPVKFDATNPDHRMAAANFLKFGRWDVKFEMEWPYTTVPQTVLMKLAEYACVEEFPVLFAEQGLNYKFGDPFNTHPHITSDQKAHLKHPRPDLKVVNG